jgi:decaprenyl-phosphate phosphoribosyltransferase
MRAVQAPTRPTRARAGVVLEACRPRQWLKNAVVVLPPAAAGVLTRSSALVAVAGAVIAFCLLASSTYLVNDVHDLASDRRHPRKRFRPIAAGELSPTFALKLAAGLALAGLLLSVAIRPALAVVGVCYLVLTLSYSMVWRDVLVADIVIVAAGFLVRAAAGAVAADVRLSTSFLAVTSACALFLVIGKRYGELDQQRTAGARPTLKRYSPRVLSALLLAAGVVGCLAYAQWAIAHPARGPWIELSAVAFAAWLGRYWLRARRGGGEAPEALILGDRMLLLSGAGWAVLFAIGLYGTS